MRATLLPALAAGMGCVAPPADGPRIVLERAADPGFWQVTYRLPAPTPRLRFERPARHYREQVWEVLTPGYAFGRGADGAQLLAAEPDAASATIRVRFPVYAESIPKEYELFNVFTDGSVAIYTGHLYVAADPETGGEPEYLRRLELVPAGSEALVVQGRSQRVRAVWDDPHGDGTYAYFGGITPLETESMIAIVDPGAPAWLVERLHVALPELFDTYAGHFREPLPWKPVVLFAFLGDERSGLSSGGGTLTGLIQMSAAGQGWREATPDSAEHLLYLFAHEAVHLWNGQLHGYEDAADSWMHEGSADAFADLMLLETGVIDARRLAERRTEALNRCLGSLADGPLSEAGTRGGFDAYYQCGNMIALWSVAATATTGDGDPLFALWRELFALSEERGNRYDREAYLAALTARGGDPELVKRLSGFVDARHDDPARAWMELFEAVGIRLEVLDRSPALVRGRLGATALKHLMASNCDGWVSFHHEGDRLRTEPREACAPFAAELKVVGIEGHRLRQDGDRALTAVRARCENGRAIRLDLEGGGSARVPCTATAPAEPLPLAFPIVHGPPVGG